MRYIKLSEKIIDWEWFTDGNMLKVWIYLLAKAQQFEDTRYLGNDLKKGQLVTGRKKIADATGLSEREVRTCLNRLKTTKEIAIETTNKYSVITILKYPLYQSNEPYGVQQKDQENDQQKTNKRPTKDQQSTTSKIDRGIDSKREEYIDTTNVVYVPSPEDLETVANLPLNKKGCFYSVSRKDADHYKELYPGVDVDQELRNMIGWLESNPTKRKTKNGVPRFINGWLSKQQNRSNALSTNTQKGGPVFFDINGDLPSLE